MAPCDVQHQLVMGTNPTFDTDAESPMENE